MSYRQATIAVLDRLDLGLELADGDQVVLARGSPQIGLQVHLTRPLLDVERDLARLPRSPLQDGPERHTPVEQLEHVGDDIGRWHNHRLDHDQVLGGNLNPAVILTRILLPKRPAERSRIKLKMISTF